MDKQIVTEREELFLNFLATSRMKVSSRSIAKEMKSLLIVKYGDEIEKRFGWRQYDKFIDTILEN